MMVLTSEPETTKEAACVSLLQHTLSHLLPLDEVEDYLKGATAVLRTGQSPALINDALRIVGEIAEKWAPATVLGVQCDQVVPLIVQCLGQRISVDMASYAMEKYWLAVPAKVEAVVLSNGLTASSSVIDQCLKWYSRMLPDLSLDAALSRIVSLLLGELAEVKLSAIRLLGQYARLGHTQKNVLRVKLLSASIPPDTCAAILLHKPPPRTAVSVKPHHESMPATNHVTPSDLLPKHPGLSPLLVIALANVKYTPEELEGLEINQYQLNRYLEDMQSCFAGKETEKNWRLRDNLIHMMRQWLRGPPAQQPTVAEIVSTNIEGICKSVKSNRTTLSSQGCQLVKDVIMLNHRVEDDFAAKVIPAFQELCSSTKLIAHTNANMVLVVFCLSLASPVAVARIVRHGAYLKNDQPRQYALLWLQIYIDRFNHAPEFDTHFVTETVLKLVSDINPKVRQAARNAFLTFEEVRANEASALFQRIPSNYAKAIRSQGQTLAASSRPGSAQGHRSLSNGRLPDTTRRVSHLDVNNSLELYPKRGTSRITRDTTSRKPASFPRTTSNPEVPLSTKPLSLSKPKASQTLLHDQPHIPAPIDPVPVPPVTTRPPQPLPFVTSVPLTEVVSTSTNTTSVDTDDTDALETLLSLRQSANVLMGVQKLTLKFDSDDDIKALGDDIARAIHQALIRFPHFLYPVLRQHPHKLAAVVPISTFIRLMCVLEYILDEYIAIVKKSGQELVLHAIIELMEWCDLPANAPDSEVTAHIIEHKNAVIIPLLIRLLRALTPEYIPSNGEYGRIVGQLFSMIVTVDDPWDVNIVELLRELQRINPARFDVEMFELQNGSKLIEKLLRDERPSTIQSNEEDFVMSPVKVAPAMTRAKTAPTISPLSIPCPEPEAPQLLKDFADVLLSEDLLRQIILKADPLVQREKRNKQIKIYTDPQEQVKSIAKPESRWFMYMLSRFQASCDSSIGADIIHEAEDTSDILNAILLLGTGNIDESGQSLILNVLRKHPQTVHPDLDLALWNFFKFAPAGKKLWGLVILKQLLINGYALDLQQLWQSLRSLIESSPDTHDDVHVALNEISDDILDGSYDVQKIVGMIFDTLADKSNLLRMNVLFQITMLTKVLMIPTSVHLVNDDFVERIDQCIRHYLVDEAVELRQASVLVYAQLVNHANRQPQIAELVSKVMDDLSDAQRKIIQYYSNHGLP